MGKKLENNSKFDFLFVIPYINPDNNGYVHKHIAFLAAELSQLGYRTAVLILPRAAKDIAKAKLHNGVIPVKRFIMAFTYYSLFNSSIFYSIFRFLYSKLSKNPFDFTIFSGIKIFYNDISSLHNATNIVFNTWEVAYFLSNKISPGKCFYIVYHNYENDALPLLQLIMDTYRSGFNIIATTEPIRKKFSLNLRCMMNPAIDPRKLNQDSNANKKIHNTLLIQLSTDEIKGGTYAAEAVHQLLQRNQNLHIYTFGDYDKLHGMNNRWYHFKNISDYDLKRLFEICEIYLSPVIEAGVPGSAVEAMINGCATISTDVSGARQLINPGVNGIIIPPRDVNAMVSSVENLMSNPETVELFRRNGALVKDRFSIDNMVKTFLGAVNFYEKEKLSSN